MSARKIKHTFERMRITSSLTSTDLENMLEVLKTYPVKGFKMSFPKTFHFDLEIILG